LDLKDIEFLNTDKDYDSEEFRSLIYSRGPHTNDFGYIKKTDSESQLLFELIAYRYEHKSLIITNDYAFSG
jgi:hypothetical protein